MHKSIFILVAFLIALFLYGLFKGTQHERSNSTQPAWSYALVERINRIEAATTQFYALYGGLPGDFKNTELLPDCANSECISGNGDNIIGQYKLSQVEPFKDERHLFWLHLRRAKLLDKLLFKDNSSDRKWGEAFPALSSGGGFHVYSYDGLQNIPHMDQREKPKVGLYLVISNDVSGEFKEDESYLFTAEEAYLVDSSMDDGKPDTGIVYAAGSPECLKNHQGNKTYNKKNGDKKCAVLYVLLKVAEV